MLPSVAQRDMVDGTKLKIRDQGIVLDQPGSPVLTDAERRDMGVHGERRAEVKRLSCWLWRWRKGP